MTTTDVENPASSLLNHHASTAHSERDISFLTQFDRIVKTNALLHALFITIGFIEFLLLIFFFTFLVKAALLAFTLAVLFLTFFGYLLIRTYMQSKQPEQFEELKSEYISSCRKQHFKKEASKSYLESALACTKLADRLQGRELTFYILPKWLRFLQPAVDRLSHWWHWKDVHLMREFLLTAAVVEHIKLVTCEPTSMMPHASLANAYVLLSGLYKPPGQSEEADFFTPKHPKELEKKFAESVEKAIEEFKILNVYAPDDPWVHEQLAYSYRDLKMHKEEIHEYEILLRLKPEDVDILFKLGVRYFQQGLNAQGLRVYEHLKRYDTQKSDELIRHYGETMSDE